MQAGFRWAIDLEELHKLPGFVKIRRSKISSYKKLCISYTGKIRDVAALASDDDDVLT